MSETNRICFDRVRCVVAGIGTFNATVNDDGDFYLEDEMNSVSIFIPKAALKPIITALKKVSEA